VQNITAVKGVGVKKAQDLARLGIDTIEDALYYFPYRYEHKVIAESLEGIHDGDAITLFGTLANINRVYIKGKVMVRAKLRCRGFTVTLLWFNQPYLAKSLYSGMLLLVHGRYHCKKEPQIAVSSHKVVQSEEDCRQYLGIIPIYRATEGCNTNFLEKMIKECLENHLDLIEEFIPEDLRKEYHLIDIKEGIRILHNPQRWEELNLARYRMVFEEFLILLLLLHGENREKEKGIAQCSDGKLVEQFLHNLPFCLTNGQKKVILEIKRDMESEDKMYRLLQGDVGAGKTIVAIYALIKTVEAGHQGALMAPTEILAKQHYLVLQQYLEPLGIRTVLLTGSMTAKEKERVYEELRFGKVQIAVGTHALIQKEVEFCDLGLAIIDEQHRFGVRQQLNLHEKGQADILVMTATPIPRSLALTIYGDLELSIIDELPKGRKAIKTWHISEQKRKGMYEFVAKELAQGRQAYVVCPLVEESEKIDLTNVYDLAEELKEKYFTDYRLAVLHGRMKDDKKEEIMADFRANRIQILVSTTVIEVGVDVSNATVMVIEDAQRFGLAQLHQLRGRVGRGSEQSYCILVSDGKGEETQRRMQAMTKTTDGFVIAEEDLALRGPGEVLGLRQHGLPDLHVASLTEDIRILEKAKVCAQEIQKEGLAQEKYARLRAKLAQVRIRKETGEKRG